MELFCSSHLNKLFETVLQLQSVRQFAYEAYTVLVF